MAKKKTDTETIPLALQGGANLTQVKKDAKKLWNAFLEADEIIKEQKEIQDSAKEALVAMGIPRSSFAEVRRKAKMSDEKRSEHNFGVQVLGDAVGVDVGDLFDVGEEEEPTTIPDPKAEEPPPPKQVSQPKGPKVIKNKGVADGEAVGLDGRSVPIEN